MYLTGITVRQKLALIHQSDNASRQHEITYLLVRFGVVSHCIPYDTCDLSPFCRRLVQEPLINVISLGGHEAIRRDDPERCVLPSEPLPGPASLSLLLTGDRSLGPKNRSETVFRHG